MIDILTAAAAFVIVLAPLVTVHEFGHFIVAKALKIGVPVFSIGFGPRLFGVRRGGTDYRVSAVPLGGYVRLAGDEADESRTGAPEEFLTRSRWQRFLVFVAGAAFNIVFAILAAALMFRVYGKPEPLRPDAYPVVYRVDAGSPAERAGLRVGDELRSIQGRDARQGRTMEEEILFAPRATKDVEVLRRGETLTIRMDTGEDPREGVGNPGWYLRYPGMPKITSVDPSLPAHGAGIRPDDEILAVDGHALMNVPQVQEAIEKSAGREMRIKLRRDGGELEVRVVPKDDDGKGRIGVGLSDGSMVRREVALGEAFAESVRWNIEAARGLFRALENWVQRIFGLDITAMKMFSGPVGIAKYSREALRSGEAFLFLLAVLSLNLGIINLMPIPVLDGGHILILTVEGVLRRNLSDKVKERVMQAGLVFLLAFFALVIVFDIRKLF